MPTVHRTDGASGCGDQSRATSARSNANGVATRKAGAERTDEPVEPHLPR